jgi:hypothetical protein
MLLVYNILLCCLLPNILNKLLSFVHFVEEKLPYSFLRCLYEKRRNKKKYKNNKNITDILKTFQTRDRRMLIKYKSKIKKLLTKS